MAFGARSWADAGVYILVVLCGVVGIVLFDARWAEICCGVVAAYGFVCLIITHAWKALIPLGSRRNKGAPVKFEAQSDSHAETSRR